MSTRGREVDGDILAGRWGGGDSGTLDSTSFMEFLFVVSKRVSDIKIIRYCS
jgi:hypothetical protein